MSWILKRTKGLTKQLKPGSCGLVCSSYRLPEKSYQKCGESKTNFLMFGKFLIAIPILLSFSPIAKAEIGMASWYSTECCKYNKHSDCPTASGRSLYALEKSGEKFAASWSFPIGSKVTVVNRDNGRSVEVTILDRGPAKRLNRIIDLSKVAFQEISSLDKGLITVEVIKNV